jgi:NAD-dependent dihydropyrimidine dehydrogenase PreA subunit
MLQNTEKLDRFVEVFQLPPAMVPHVEFVVTEQEVDLVIGLGDEAMTLEQIAEMMDLPMPETEELVRNAYHRTVIKKGPGRGPYARSVLDEDGPTTYSAAVFYRRLDPLAMYENWGDVPAEAREAVIDWQLQEFIEIWKPMVEEIEKDPDAYVRMPNRDVLLLDEALAMVEAADHHVVRMCDCRAIVRACDRPVEACISLGEYALIALDQGHGRQVSKDEMKRIVIEADRAGLMHTGDHNWQERGGPRGFCNCCACDCYPFRAGMKLGMDRRWPRSHYVAERDMEKCLQCGKCTRRCHFGAFYHDGTRTEINGKRRKTVQFDPEKCWGCGLCATACPEGAISMVALAV